MSDDETREYIEEVLNDEPPVQEAVIETILEEEEAKPVNTKSKAKSKAKRKIKITKRPVEPAETVELEPVIEIEVEEKT